MPPVPVLPAPELAPLPLRRRAVALALVVAIHVLLVALLIGLARNRVVPPPPAPQSITLLPIAEPARPPARRAVPAKAKSARAAKQRASPVVAPVPIVPPPSRLPKLNGLIPGAETFDLAKVAPPKTEPVPVETADAAPAPGAASGPVYGPTLGPAGRGATGPNGEPLYPAEWAREPTNAELATYLPPRVPQDAWAEIACRTVPGLRVDDCFELAQSPVGSGLSRGIRLAAWQFRVRPPRIGGKLEVGTWVRIRIDFTERIEK